MKDPYLYKSAVPSFTGKSHKAEGSGNWGYHANSAIMGSVQPVRIKTPAEKRAERMRIKSLQEARKTDEYKIRRAQERRKRNKKFTGRVYTPVGL